MFEQKNAKKKKGGTGTEKRSSTHWMAKKTAQISK